MLGFKLNINALEEAGVAALCKNENVHDVVYLVTEHIKTCQCVCKSKPKIGKAHIWTELKSQGVIRFRKLISLIFVLFILCHLKKTLQSSLFIQILLLEKIFL